MSNHNNSIRNESRGDYEMEEQGEDGEINLIDLQNENNELINPLNDEELIAPQSNEEEMSGSDISQEESEHENVVVFVDDEVSNEPGNPVLLHNFAIPPIIYAYPNPNIEPEEGFEDESSNDDPNENIQNDFHHSTEENESNDSSGHISNEDNSGEPLPDFDHELPTRHVYLGEAMEELRGRVVLDENSILEVPLLLMNFNLIPGQLLPMTVFHAVFQSALRRSILNERVFGVIHNSGLDSDPLLGGRQVVSKGAVGTLAEIYEFQEESDLNSLLFENRSVPLSNFALKARGGQRFNVLEVRRQADGNLMGKIKIRPEVRLPHPISHLKSDSNFRYIFPVRPEAEGSLGLNEEENGASGVEREERRESALQNLTKQNRLIEPRMRYYSALTPWPKFVYDLVEEKRLVERILNRIKTDLKGLAKTEANIPTDASELSFWLAQNLTMDDGIRKKILEMDCPTQRLRFELKLYDYLSHILCCRHCKKPVAEKEDIFSMSVEGCQGTYVNPSGYIHETMTLSKVKSTVHTRGFPSTEASWFQGYAWTIAECRACGRHLGWKFTATEKMKPSKFWGLSRKSVTFGYDLSFDSLNEPPSLANTYQNQLPY